MSKLKHRYYLPINSESYSVTHLRNAVHPDQYVQLYSFPKRRLGTRGALIGLFLMFASLFIALEAGAFDWIYELFRGIL